MRLLQRFLRAMPQWFLTNLFD
uniref:Uncharacterized protein n=1 Tax=Anopheles albimanus TaxID=7167 RepID=A0A182FY05_ANOAL